MKPAKRLNLTLAISTISLSAMCTDVFAQAVVENELDITIRVMEENETPVGFINRLPLPDFDSLNSAVVPPQTIQDSDIQIEIDAATTLADDTSLILTDRIVEAVSIDGTTAVDDALDPVVEIPGEIVDVLNPDLPLQDSLQDTLDIVDSLSTQDDGIGTVNSLTDSVIEIDAIVDNLAPEIDQTDSVIADDLLNEIELSPPDDLLDPPLNDVPVQDALDDIADDISDLPVP